MLSKICAETVPDYLIKELIYNEEYFLIKHGKPNSKDSYFNLFNEYFNYCETKGEQINVVVLYLFNLIFKKDQADLSLLYKEVKGLEESYLSIFNKNFHLRDWVLSSFNKPKDIKEFLQFFEFSTVSQVEKFWFDIIQLSSSTKILLILSALKEVHPSVYKYLVCLKYFGRVLVDDEFYFIEQSNHEVIIDFFNTKLKPEHLTFFIDQMVCHQDYKNYQMVCNKFGIKRLGKFRFYFIEQLSWWFGATKSKLKQKVLKEMFNITT